MIHEIREKSYEIEIKSKQVFLSPVRDEYSKEKFINKEEYVEIIKRAHKRLKFMSVAPSRSNNSFFKAPSLLKKIVLEIKAIREGNFIIMDDDKSCLS